MRAASRQLLPVLLTLLVGGLPALSRGGYVLCIGSDGHAHLAVAGHAEQAGLANVSHCHADECCDHHAEPHAGVSDFATAFCSEVHSHPACVDLSVTSADRATAGKTAVEPALVSPLALPPIAALVLLDSDLVECPRFDADARYGPSPGAMLRTIILLT